MLDIIDYKLDISRDKVKDFIKNEIQFKDKDNIDMIEEELFNFLNKTVLTLSCYVDQESKEISFDSMLLNQKSIVKNTDVDIVNDFIVNT